MKTGFFSWGRCFKYPHWVYPLFWPPEDLTSSIFASGLPCLAVGLGRSYGDSCLNESGMLITTRGLDRFITFDREQGVLCCEAGVSLGEILELIVPSGWFLPVVPGTKHVTVGGAIANDVHGKNHHRLGTFGRHLRRFELRRSDGQTYLCSQEQHAPLFRATIGGLGLTGLISWAEIQLKKGGAFVDVETIKFKNLDAFFKLSEASSKDFEYTVAWIDFTAKGSSLGRGIFLRGQHLEAQVKTAVPLALKTKLTIPFDAPNFLLNRLTIAGFNSLYYHKQLCERQCRQVHYDPFFFPLDGIEQWNRIYGKRGFYQYQLLLPKAKCEAFAAIFKLIVDSGLASFLAVFKEFGSLSSPGLLSFPEEGYTLALDFPNSGKDLKRLFMKLDALVAKYEGRLYPAKDGHMSQELFRSSYPEWQSFATLIDPAFSSSFWRRINKDG